MPPSPSFRVRPFELLIAKTFETEEKMFKVSINPPNGQDGIDATPRRITISGKWLSLFLFFFDSFDSLWKVLCDVKNVRFVKRFAESLWCSRVG